MLQRPFTTGLFCITMLLLVPLGGTQSVTAPADDAELEVQADSYEFEPDSGRAVGSGDVELHYGQLYVRADHVEVDTRSGAFRARGNIEVQRGVFVWQGDKLSGNYRTAELDFGSYEAALGEVFFRGESGRRSPDGRVSFGPVTLSTCEYLASDPPHAHYTLSADRVVYYPNGLFKAYDVWYKLGGLPVFYLPVVWSDTKSGGAGGVEISPGYDSEWGPYILTSKSWPLGANGETTMMLDLRANNGVAVGNETLLRAPGRETFLHVYGMDDQDPPETTAGFNRRFEVEDQRYRLKLSHRQSFSRRLDFRLQLEAMSDIDMLEDWYEDEYDRLQQSTSFADLTYSGDNFDLSLRARPRVNDFYSVVERLPELRLSIPRHPAGVAGILYEADMSAAHLEMKWRDFDRPRGPGLLDPEDYETWRVDMLHMVYRPFRLGALGQLIPRAGLRLTYYDNSSDTALTPDDLSALHEADDPNRSTGGPAIVNYDEDGGSRTRVVGEVGLEWRQKFTRIWPELHSQKWGIDGLRHVVEPYANYTYIPEPSEEREHLYFFDHIDRITEQNMVRVGVKQRWQTRRNRRIYTLASLDSYADFHFEAEDEREHAGDLGIDAELSPQAGVSLKAYLLGDMGEGSLNRATVALRVGDPDVWESELGYSFQNDYTSHTLLSMGSTFDNHYAQRWLSRRFLKSNYLRWINRFRITDRMDGRVHLEYDADADELALQSYEIIRDLHCWMGSLGVQEEEGDIRLMLMFYLKAYPEVRIEQTL